MSVISVIAESGDIEAARIALDAGINPNQTAGKANSTYFHPLTTATYHEHTELFSLLLQRGACLSKTATGGIKEMLQWASNGNVDLLNLCLDNLRPNLEYLNTDGQANALALGVLAAKIDWPNIDRAGELVEFLDVDLLAAAMVSMFRSNSQNPGDPDWLQRMHAFYNAIPEDKSEPILMRVAARGVNEQAMKSLWATLIAYSNTHQDSSPKISRRL
ncbi:hypothetical protein ACKF11_13050 [Methylobacillus sp. Pita2]|uniref:hypothetical protein n=1 Tax=Methylobacillus sp. Pita2 TaxID=3383245 RepID=UPI0038B4F556